MDASQVRLHAARGDGQCVRIESRAKSREGIADHRVRRSAFEFVRCPRRMRSVRRGDVTRDLFEEARLPHAAFTRNEGERPRTLAGGVQHVPEHRQLRVPADKGKRAKTRAPWRMKPPARRPARHPQARRCHAPYPPRREAHPRPAERRLSPPHRSAPRSRRPRDLPALLTAAKRNPAIRTGLPSCIACVA